MGDRWSSFFISLVFLTDAQCAHPPVCVYLLRMRSRDVVFQILIYRMVAHYVRTNQGGYFAPLFQKRKPSGLSEKTPFFFLHRGSPKRAKPSFGGSRSFFFWGYLLKRKSVKGILVSIDSATNYRCQDFLAAFLSQNRRKEKLTKETPNRLRGERCCAQGATFKKVDKTIDGCCANTPINPNLDTIYSHSKKSPHKRVDSEFF